MLCERCKIREANIQYTEVINGVRTEHHFCAQCARELDFGQYSAIFDGEFPLAKLLSGLLGSEEPAQDTDRLQQIQCPSCGMTFEDYKRTGLLGCAACYDVFREQMEPVILRIQGSTAHEGKSPLSDERQLRLLDEQRALRGELERALREKRMKEADSINRALRRLNRSIYGDGGLDD